MTLYTYHLQGTDLANPTDWLRVDLANLDFGPSPIVSLLGVGSELSLLQVQQEDNSPLLDGTLWPLRYWHSSDPQALPANWQAEIVADDLPQSSPPQVLSPQILVDGQPAFAQYFRLRQGFPGGERTWTKLVWCVYVP